jgi:hypothetical protein
VTSREIGTTGDSTKRCRREGALDVGGTSRTDANGTVEIRLTDYICQPPTPYEFFRPINFVATPQSRAPVFLTSVQTPTGGDVAIMVFSWDANGSPLRNVSFDWRCFVPAEVQFA